MMARGNVLGAIEALPALAKPVVFETGYGASGLPHIGTFLEVARTTMVRHAFRALTEDAIPTRLISFSDDMDALRRVPDNVPAREALAQDLGRRLTSVRDPFGEYESFGAHNNARMRAFLDAHGFDYEFLSATECYRAGRFDKILLRVLERFDAVQEIMLPTLGPERRATYSPFLPISPRTGRVLQVPTLERHLDRGTIVFEDEDGAKTEIAVTGGRVKLQWKPDWACGQGPHRFGEGLLAHLQGSGRRAPRGFQFRAVPRPGEPEDLQVEGQRLVARGMEPLRLARQPRLLPLRFAPFGQAALFRCHTQGG